MLRGIKTKSHLNVSYFGLTEYKYCVKGNIHSHFIFAFSPWRIQNIFFRTVLIRKSIMFNCGESVCKSRRAKKSKYMQLSKITLYTVPSLSVLSDRVFLWSMWWHENTLYYVASYHGKLTKLSKQVQYLNSEPQYYFL